MTVAETIKQITKDHLLNGNGMALGQCLTAVGWVGGTVPELTEADGLVELSMADVAGGAIAVGAALARRRPIYIVRYQGFQWYDAATILNYAAKSKEMWNVPCPLFVRSIAMEGAIGPVAGSSHHGMFHRMPGITIASPMTPGEYRAVWEYFISHDEPVYASEHRKSFAVDYEMPDVIHPKADITLFPISVTRFAAVEAAKKLAEEDIVCNIIHVLWLKPFVVGDIMKKAITSSTYGGLVLDDDYENGVSKSLAYDLMHAGRKEVRVLGLEERSAGFAAHLDNLPPSAEKITKVVRQIVGK
jgi:pyruvate/2-oxoglutarate/acetoin dehydrogenase E1 component